eukprot:3844285-Amphidinium_carterae.1
MSLVTVLNHGGSCQLDIFDSKSGTGFRYLCLGLSGDECMMAQEKEPVVKEKEKDKEKETNSKSDADRAHATAGARTNNV